MAHISSVSLVFTVLFLTGSLRFADGSWEEMTTEASDIISNSGLSSGVKAIVGSTASLFCNLPIGSNSKVGWWRITDRHILAVGDDVVTDDMRFRVRNGFPSASSVLQIVSVKIQDSGTYECYDTSSRLGRHKVFLSVDAPETKIVGEPIRSVMEGVSLNLTCVIEPAPAPEETLVWMHVVGNVVTFPNGERFTTVEERDSSLRSTLLINNIQEEDAGNYTCIPSYGKIGIFTVRMVHGQSEIGTVEAEPSSANVVLGDVETGSTPEETGSTPEVTSEGTSGSDEKRKLDEYEMEETTGLTLAEVQRLVMLKQLKVLAVQERASKLQIDVLWLQKENLMLMKQTKNGRIHRIL